MNFNLLALAITAVGSISLGIAVYQRTPDRVWNRLFAIHATLAGLWTFCNFMIMASDSAAEAGIYLRLSHPLVVLGICTVVDFAWVFPERIEYAESSKRMLLYGLGVVFGTIGFAPNLYHSIELGPGVVNVNYGWPLIPFGIFAVSTLAYADIIVLRKAMRLEGIQRAQVIWVLAGLAGTHLVGLAVIIIVPLVWGTTAYSGWGASGVIIQVGGIAYAIAKHRLMPPEMAARRTLTAALTVGLVLAIGISGLHLLEPLLLGDGVSLQAAYIGAGLLMGMLILLLHGRVSDYLRRNGSSEGDLDSIHTETSSQILRTLDSAQLLQLLADTLNYALQPTRVAVYTLSRSEEELVPRVVLEESEDVRGDGETPIDLRHRVLQLVAEEGSLLTRDQIFRFASLSEARSFSQAMDELGAQMVAPMIWEDELIGAVMLGPRRSGEMYEEEHLRFVAELSLETSLALRNADLYAQTAALKDFNERILSQMDNAVVVTDDQQHIVVFNPAAERLFGIPADRALGSPIDVLPEGIANCIRGSIGSGRILSSQQFEIERGDEVIPLACSTSPLESDAEKQRQGAVAVISDLTLIHELEEERQEAERLALIRVISAGMAHEIRNPLVAIRTFAELAPRRLDDPDFRSNFITVVHEEIGRIDKLVGDLMTLSKPADAVVEQVDIDQVVRGVMRATAGMAESKGIELRRELAELNRVTMGDETRLYQALLNIVSNAIDAEPQGGHVTLKTEKIDHDNGDSVRISVHNPGSYIPQDQIDEIFRPFVSKKANGTGLGLAMCQTILEEHNGQITVDSTPESGTTFVVELPLSQSTAAASTGES